MFCLSALQRDDEPKSQQQLAQVCSLFSMLHSTYEHFDVSSHVFCCCYGDSLASTVSVLVAMVPGILRGLKKTNKKNRKIKIDT